MDRKKYGPEERNVAYKNLGESRKELRIVLDNISNRADISENHLQYANILTESKRNLEYFREVMPGRVKNKSKKFLSKLESDLKNLEKLLSFNEE